MALLNLLLKQKNNSSVHTNDAVKKDQKQRYAEHQTQEETENDHQNAILPLHDLGKTPISPAEHGKTPLSRLSPLPLLIQPKLTINEPGDEYEREADKMAEKVIWASINTPLTSRPVAILQHPQIQRKCTNCEAKEDEDENDVLMRKATTQFDGNHQQINDRKTGIQSESLFADQLQSSKGSGAGLAEDTRTFMESVFQSDFSKVRVHTDPRAVEMNQQIRALAFTHRYDIYFNNGQYNTNSVEGKKLLAHELTHTIQQSHLPANPIQTKMPEMPPLGKPEIPAIKSNEPELKQAGDANEIRFEKPVRNVELKNAGGIADKQSQTNEDAQQKLTEISQTINKLDSKSEENNTKKGTDNDEKDLEKLEKKDDIDGANPVAEKAAEQEQQAAVGSGETDSSAGLAIKMQSLVATPLAFSEQDAEKEQIAEIQQANNVGSMFFGDLLAQIQGLNGLSGNIQPRIESVASEVKANVTRHVESQKIALLEQVIAAESEAKNLAKGAKSKVNSEFNASLADIKKTADKSVVDINKEYKIIYDSLIKKETDQKTDIEKIYSDSDKDFRKIGVDVGDDGVKIGEAKAKESLSKKIYEMDSLTDGYLTDRRCDARAKASRDISKAYRDEYIEIANEQAEIALKGKEKDDENLALTIENAKKSLLTQQKAALKSINDTSTQATKQANDLKKSLNKSIDNQLNSILGTLNTQKTNHFETLEGIKTSQLAQIEQASIQASSELSNNLNTGIGELVDGLLEAKTGLNGKEAPSLEELTEKTGSVGKQISTGIGTTMASIEDAFLSINENFAQYQSTAEEVVNSTIVNIFDGIKITSDGFNDGMKTAQTHAQSSFAELKKTHRTNNAGVTKNAKEGFTDIAKKIDDCFKERKVALHDTFKQSIEGLEKSLRENFEAVDGLKATIEAKAKEAADAEQPAWKDIVKWILIIAIVIVVALVVGPAVIAAIGGVLGASAGATVAATIIGGAIVGAATSASIQVVSNAFDGKPLMDGVGRAALVGAISGALGGGFGLAIKSVAPIRQFVIDQAFGAVVGTGIDVIQTGHFPTTSQIFKDLGVGLALSLVTLGATKTQRGQLRINKSESWGQNVGEGLRAKIKPPKVEVAPPNVDATISKPIADVKPETKPNTPTDHPAPAKSDMSPVKQPPEHGTSTSTPQKATEPAPSKPAQTDQPLPHTETEVSTKPKSIEPDAPKKPDTKPKEQAVDSDSNKPKSKSKEPESTKKPDTKTKEQAVDSDSKPKSKSNEQEGAGNAKPSEMEATPGQAGKEQPVKSQDGSDAPKRSTHEDHPADSDGVVAKQKTEDGHEVKVLKSGQVAVCSECGTLRMKYADELANNSMHLDELNRIEAIADPKLKAQEAKALRDVLENAQKVPSAKDAEVPIGNDLAKQVRLPDAPKGHHWLRQPDGGLTLKRNPGYKGPLLDYNPDATKVKGIPKGFEKAKRSHLSEREKTLPKALQERVPLQQDKIDEILRTAESKVVDGERRWIDGKTGKAVPGDKITIHPDTGEKIKGDIAFGHSQDDIAWLRYQELHRNDNPPITRDQVIKDQNVPEIYRIEWTVSNSQAGAKAKADYYKNEK
jgi:hypothetical protein